MALPEAIKRTPKKEIDIMVYIILSILCIWVLGGLTGCYRSNYIKVFALNSDTGLIEMFNISTINYYKLREEAYNNNNTEEEMSFEEMIINANVFSNTHKNEKEFIEISSFSANDKKNNTVIIFANRSESKYINTTLLVLDSDKAAKARSWTKLLPSWNLNYTIAFSGTSHNPQFPSFFLLGERETASTSLANLIIEHPGFCNGLIQEDGTPIERISDVKSHPFPDRFMHCGKYEHSIDGSPGYVQSKEVLNAMIDHYSLPVLQNKKFIIILREPASSQFSLYEHRMRDCTSHMLNHIKYVKPQLLHHHDKHGKKTTHMGIGWSTEDLCTHPDGSCSFLNCSSMDINSTLVRAPSKSLYTFEEYVNSKYFQLNDGNLLEHVQQWVEAVGRESVFIIKYNDLVSNTFDTMNRIQRFFDLKKAFDNTELPDEFKSKKESKLKIDCIVFDKLYEYYKRKNSKLYDYINGDKKPDFEATFTFLDKEHCLNQTRM